LSPQSQIPPSLSNAYPVELPAAIAAKGGSVPELACTLTGHGEFVVVPFPNWPELLYPHAQTLPFSSNAYPFLLPAAIAVKGGSVPELARTLTGHGEFVVVPFPNSPELLSPHAQTLPSLSSAYPEAPPAAIAVKGGSVPELARTRTGHSESVVVPLPSSPRWLYPHAQTLPSLSNAYPVLLHAAIAVKGGSVPELACTRTGDDERS